MSHIPVDIVGVLDWASKQKKSSDRSESRKKPHPEMEDLITMLQKRRAENAMIDSFFKDVEKLGKKEDDKKSWWKLNVEQTQMLLLVTFSLTAPAWVWLMLNYMKLH